MKLEEAMAQSRLSSAVRVLATGDVWFVWRKEGYTLIHNAEQSLYRSATWRFPTLEALITYAQQYSEELHVTGDEWLPDNAEIRNQLWHRDGPAPIAPPNVIIS
jgi:hypothetical protein